MQNPLSRVGISEIEL